ncbi:hypothetical protein K474DRAFT_1650318 [Panus rudis PR-1116 ss-1]|nr:hypothetical protein K474DRAFT_1650318 [Panus rudis PR-1116 ss-1]
MPPKGPWWKLFWSNGTRYKQNGTYNAAWCLGCLNNHVNLGNKADRDNVALGILDPEQARTREQLFECDTISAHPPVEPVHGRASTMHTHARKCPFVSKDDFVLVDTQAKAEASGNTRSSPASQKNFTIPRESRNSKSSAPPIIDPGEPWTATKNDQFARDLCKLFIACDFAWNAADNIQLQLFFAKYIPQAKVPDRRKLSGIYLDQEVTVAENKTKADIAGRLGTLQCDGWRNVAKVPVVTSMVSASQTPYLVKTHDMSREPKTGDRLYELVQDDIREVSTKFDVETIAVCCDDGPDGRKARRLIDLRMFWIITTVCWAHQINLIFGEYLQLPQYHHCIELALEVIKWFNNHGKALSLLQEEQKQTYKDRLIPLMLLLPVITRWTAHYCAITRLLQICIAVKACCLRHEEALLVCAGRAQEHVNKAQSILDTVSDPTFWRKLTEIKTHLEPLAIAANVSQSTSTRLDQVLLMLANLYRIYGTTTLDEHVRSTIHGSLEKRWKKADQDIYILAGVDSSNPGEPISTGRNGVTKLAIRLLSVIANSASCERLRAELITAVQEDAVADLLEPNTDDVEGPGPLILSHEDSNTTPESQERSPHFGLRRNTCIPLSQLFCYPEHSTANEGLEFYWKGAVRNLEQEIANYELLQEMGTSSTS